MPQNNIYDDCPFQITKIYQLTIEEWDDDDGDIIALLCEGCPDRDECSEKDYTMKENE